MESRIHFGNQAEDAVVAYLIQQKYHICARNFRWMGGEIDIIARKDDVLAFVEVKARRECQFHLSEVIVPAKQLKIIKTARRYIFQQAYDAMVFRFDVALLSIVENDWNIKYIANAFTDAHGW